MNGLEQGTPVSVKFRKGGYALLESHHGEGFFMDWREDPFAKIIYVVGGEGTLHLPEKTFAIQAQSLFVVPEGARHRIADRPGHPLSLVGVCLRRRALSCVDLVQAAGGEWRMETDSALTRRVSDWIRLLLVEERLQKPWGDALQISLVSQILVELVRTPVRTLAGKADSAGRVSDYIRELETTFWKIEDLATVAASHGLSLRRFTQVFRSLAGESWLARVCRLRLEHAARLSRTTSLPVRSIAFEVGYRDPAHFYRAFKARFGMSPGIYRARDEADRR